MDIKIHSPNVRIIAADPVMEVYSLETPKGGKYTLIRDMRSKLSLRKENKEVGAIILSSNRGGAIWKGEFHGVHGKEKEVIAEYGQINGQYRVTPIKDGCLKLDCIKNIHPLDYLLENV